MHLPILQMINFTLILVLLVFLVRYLWDLFFGDAYEPPLWSEAWKAGQLNTELRKAARNYGDKIRFFTLWLQFERIRKEQIEGDLAELGVYKGETARLLRMMAPGRKLHLFDTFNGFTSADLQNEKGEAATYTSQNFADTSLDKVLKRVGGSPDMISAHPGYFPDSTRGMPEIRYALVSMDADLYNPTLAGLRYFYPRLAPGGVILIHDYNGKWEGLQQAVAEFTAGIPETPVLVADPDSTLMIVRNRF
jgi:O-methyltransferase